MPQTEEGGHDMVMLIIFGIALTLLPYLLFLALKLRLGIPLVYLVLMLTVFRDWCQTHAALADGIFFAMLGLVALSWVITAVRKIYDIIADYREERARVKLVISRVRQARANGESVVNTDGIW